MLSYSHRSGMLRRRCSLPNSIRVMDHAVRRYATRVLGMCELLPRHVRESVAGMIHRALARATPLSPAERATFADPRWGVNPNDDLRRHGAAVFVLSHPQRGGTM